MKMQQPRLLITVDEALHVTGRGCLLTPGITSESMPSVQIGDRVRLFLPSGETTESVIHGIDAVHNRNTEKPEIRFFLTLPREVKKEDIPKGTEVLWLPGSRSEAKS
jgi:hypothetical protein